MHLVLENPPAVIWSRTAQALQVRAEGRAVGEAQFQPGARRPLRASAGASASGWRFSPQTPCIQSAPRHAVLPRYCEPLLAGW